jgi:hypothetical protein
MANIVNIKEEDLALLKRRKKFTQPPAVKKATEYASVAAYEKAVAKYNKWANKMNGIAKDLNALAREADKQDAPKKGMAGVIKRTSKKK